MQDPCDGFVSVDGLPLHYLEWGDRRQPPLLLLHGGSAHAHWWDFVAPAMADRYRVLALDLRGHGDSGWVEPPDYALETHAADIGQFVEALGLSDPTLVGHSFGGMAAIVYAAATAQRLAALVVVDSRTRISARAARFMEALSRLPHPVYASREDAVRRFRLLPAANCARAEILAHVARHAVRELDDGTWTLKFDRRGLPTMGAGDLSRTLGAVRCPVLVVRGAHSAIVPAAALAEIRATAPRARVAEIPGAHHHVMLDRPQVFVQVLETFLATTRADSHGAHGAAANPNAQHDPAPRGHGGREGRIFR